MKKNLLAENMRRFGTKNLKPNLKESYGSNDESKHKYNVEDFPEGSKILFNDGEEWIVVKPGMRGSGSFRSSNEITIKPFNKLAKDKNVSLSIDVDLDFLNANVKSINKSQLHESVIHIPNLSWQDQTRIIKWLSQQDYDRKDYKVIEKGDNITIDTFGLERFEIEEIKSYLKSQNYKFSINV